MLSAAQDHSHGDLIFWTNHTFFSYNSEPSGRFFFFRILKEQFPTLIGNVSWWLDGCLTEAFQKCYRIITKSEQCLGPSAMKLWSWKDNITCSPNQTNTSTFCPANANILTRYEHETSTFKTGQNCKLCSRPRFSSKWKFKPEFHWKPSTFYFSWWVYSLLSESYIFLGQTVKRLSSIPVLQLLAAWRYNKRKRKKR